MQEVCGAVQWIDDPSMGPVGPLDRATLLKQESITWPRARQLLVQNLLGAMICSRDVISGSLLRYLQLFDFAKVARKRTAGFASGGRHDVH